jgi:hypothetical protein
MLALLSRFVRWLRLDGVRALKQSTTDRPAINLPETNDWWFPGWFCRIAYVLAVLHTQSALLRLRAKGWAIRAIRTAPDNGIEARVRLWCSAGASERERGKASARLDWWGERQQMKQCLCPDDSALEIDIILAAFVMLGYHLLKTGHTRDLIEAIQSANAKKPQPVSADEESANKWKIVEQNG